MFLMIRISLFLLALVGLPALASVEITHASIRLLPPTVPNTSAYLTVSNPSQQDQVIVAAKADFAQKTEIHNHLLVNDMMRMQQQAEVLVKAGETVKFAPGGLHIMLFGLKHPLVENQRQPITLILQDGSTQTFDAIIQRPGAHHHHH
jgi:copper(I)-binding protein